ncbi:MAG: hypothetical protein DI528_08180 [Shinella sp.]|nr:MAG: hypothetical protein DI528_08180 [Shinella sp.]
MKKSWAEYKREARKRERLERRKQADAVAPYLRTPFCDFFQQRTGHDLSFYADAMGKEWWEFRDDRGIEPLTDGALVQEDLDRAANSLGRAELIAGCLLDAAGELTHLISVHKCDEITARIAEIEQSDLSDPEVKKQALADIARLTKMRDQLNKQVRWTFQQWKVTGE